MAERMQRMWSPGTNLGYEIMALGDELEFRIFPSLALEQSQDRSVRDFTVTRIVGNLQFSSASESVMMWGIRLANEAEAIGTFNPGHDQTIDWMLWGSISVGTTNQLGIAASTIEIDNRSQRKSRGMDSSLRLYIYNAAGGTAEVSVALRVLALI